jgi:thiol-disulfide isomerase/thioredoxin
MRIKLNQLALFGLVFTLPSYALEAGDAVALDAVAQADFIQGEAPAKWNENEVYIFECWATWCGPCIAMIPHMDELHEEYHEKGIHVYGMNVMEDGKDKVLKFVAEKGDGMSYPVAYVGRGGAFEKSWIQAAGVRGIPHAFVVKNGKLLLATHPNQLKEEVISALLAGGDKEKAALAKLRSENASKEEVTKAVQAFRTATWKKDLVAMQAAYEQAEKLAPDAPHLVSFQVEMKMVAEDWAGVEKIFTALGEDQAFMMGRNLGYRLDAIEELPESLRKAILASLESATQKHLFDAAIMARQYWALGEKEKARVSAKNLMLDSRLPKEVAAAFADSFETETPDSIGDFSKAVGEAMKK